MQACDFNDLKQSNRSRARKGSVRTIMGEQSKKRHDVEFPKKGARPHSWSLQCRMKAFFWTISTSDAKKHKKMCPWIKTAANAPWARLERITLLPSSYTIYRPLFREATRVSSLFKQGAHILPIIDDYDSSNRWKTRYVASGQQARINTECRLKR